MAQNDIIINGYYPPDGGYGWVVVGAIILINVSILTLVQNFGIIYGTDLKEWGVSEAQKSFLLHLQSSLFCIFGLFMSPLLKKYSFRYVCFLGASIMCAGVFLSSFSNSYIALIFSVSVIMGIGQGILMPATYIATNSYFKEKLTLAVSISVTGAGFSPIFMPKICDILLDVIGRKYTVLSLFLFALTALPCCLLLKPLKKIEKENIMKEVEMERNGDIYKSTTVPVEPNHTYFQKIYKIFDLELLKDRTYVLIVLGQSISFSSELNIVLMMQFLLPKLAHFERSDVAYAIMLQSIADIIGRFFVPFLAHYSKCPPKVSYSLALVVASIARTGLTFFYDKQILVYICCTIIGLTKGSRAVFQSVIIPKFVPLEKLPAANGINMLATGVFSLIIGPILGKIQDVNNSYIYSLHAASGLSLMCVSLWIIEYFLTKNSKEQVNEDINE